jgi:hypothetical protein
MQMTAFLWGKEQKNWRVLSEIFLIFDELH